MKNILFVLFFFSCRAFCQTTCENNAPLICSTAIPDPLANIQGSQNTNVLQQPGGVYLATVKNPSLFNGIFSLQSTSYQVTNPDGCLVVRFKATGTATINAVNVQVDNLTNYPATVGCAGLTAVNNVYCLKICNPTLSGKLVRFNLNFFADPQSVNGNVIVSEFGLNTTPVLLPTRFKNINLDCVGNMANIKWDADFTAYELQGSENARDWTILAATLSKSYKYTGFKFYRVVGITTANDRETSPVVIANCDEKGSKIYPNPAQDVATLHTYSEKEGAEILYIIDVAGKVIRDEKIKLKKGKNFVPINIANLPPGVYFIRVNNTRLRLQKLAG